MPIFVCNDRFVDDGNPEQEAYFASTRGAPAAGRSQGWLATIGEEKHPFSCTVCQGKLFADREVKLNTSGAEFLGVGWANQSAKGLVCQRCGYVHLFMPGMVRMWEPPKDVSPS